MLIGCVQSSPIAVVLMQEYFFLGRFGGFSHAVRASSGLAARGGVIRMGCGFMEG